MNVSTRFTVALHILTLLASSPGEALTSEYIAASVNTNPVVIRRLLSLLRKAGWADSKNGKGGGWTLVVSADTITLAKVRKAVKEGSAFAMHSQPPSLACLVGRNIQSALGQVYQRAERKLEEALAQTSIQDVLRSVQKRGRSK